MRTANATHLLNVEEGIDFICKLIGGENAPVLREMRNGFLETGYNLSTGEVKSAGFVLTRAGGEDTIVIIANGRDEQLQVMETLRDALLEGTAERVPYASAQVIDFPGQWAGEDKQEPTLE